MKLITIENKLYRISNKGYKVYKKQEEEGYDQDTNFEWLKNIEKKYTPIKWIDRSFNY